MVLAGFGSVPANRSGGETLVLLQTFVDDLHVVLIDSQAEVTAHSHPPYRR